MTTHPIIWVLLDDRTGNRSQALGVASALGLPFTEIELQYGPAAKLPNVILGASLNGLATSSKNALKAPWPSLIVSAGRRTAPIARWIKKQSDGDLHLVQIMDPGSGSDDFDLICVPAHDQPVMKPNTIVIAGAPHTMTLAKLAKSKEIWSDRLNAAKTPRIAVMIGGSTRRRKFSDEMAIELCRQANQVAALHGGSLLVTTSRRTGDAVNTISTTLGESAMLHRWDSKDDNPYAGYLALADGIIVTGESVSMCSEACATGKPVYIYAPPDLITSKHGRLHQALYDGGYAQPFAGQLDLDWAPERLNVADRIAKEIHARGLVSSPA